MDRTSESNTRIEYRIEHPHRNPKLQLGSIAGLDGCGWEIRASRDR